MIIIISSSIIIKIMMINIIVVIMMIIITIIIIVNIIITIIIPNLKMVIEMTVRWRRNRLSCYESIKKIENDPFIESFFTTLVMKIRL